MATSRAPMVLLILALVAVLVGTLLFFQMRDPMVLILGVMIGGACALASAFLRANAQRIVCKECGAANLPHAKFCSQCGKPF